jgi:hypothetical protein
MRIEVISAEDIPFQTFASLGKDKIKPVSRHDSKSPAIHAEGLVCDRFGKTTKQ